MPFYGQSFKLADEQKHGLNEPSFGGASAGEFTQSEGFLSYYEVDVWKASDIFDFV